MSAHKRTRWWFGLSVQGLALILIAQAAFRAASTHVDPTLGGEGDPKYLAATEHFWANLFLGIALFAFGWWLRPRSPEHQQRGAGTHGGASGGEGTLEDLLLYRAGLRMGPSG